MKLLFSVFNLLITASLVLCGSSEDNTKCGNEINEYEDCLFHLKGLTTMKIFEYCSNFKTQKCQKFYENPFSDEVLPTCKFLHEEGENILGLNMLKTKKAFSDLICKDNSFVLTCPFAYNIMKNITSIFDKNYLVSIRKEICQNQICINEVKHIFEVFAEELGESGLGFAFMDMSTAQKFIYYLNSNECLSIANPSNFNTNTKSNSNKDFINSINAKMNAKMNKNIDSTNSYSKNFASPYTNNNNNVDEQFDNLTNESNKCGKEFGSCPNGECCSRHGYCGNTDAYCGVGCQAEFGACKVYAFDKSTNSSTLTRVQIPTSTISGRCGPNYGKCSKKGQCCSSFGYCGENEEYCGVGCQKEYGLCADATLKNIPVSIVEGRCGPEYGACGKEGQCCSKYGFCGKTDEYCNVGCQKGYGLCR